MTQIKIKSKDLYAMIGLHVRYQGAICQVLEILEEESTLILSDLESHTSIQTDQYGEAHRRVPQTYSIKILNVDQLEFSGEFLSLEPLNPHEIPTTESLADT